MGNYFFPDPDKIQAKPINQLYHLKKSNSVANILNDTSHFDKTDEILMKKIKKIKILYNHDSIIEADNKRKTNIIGILITYIDVKGKVSTYKMKNYYTTIPTNTYGNCQSTNGNFYSDFKLEDGEFIKQVIVKYDNSIHSMNFITTHGKKQSSYNIGYGGEKEYKFNMKNNIIVGFYGGFRFDSISYIGVYYASVRQICIIILPYFILKNLIKTCINEESFKKSEIFLKRSKKNEPYHAFYLLCKMPNYVFFNALKYI